MPVLRDPPYAAFNFLVNLSDAEPGGAESGFSEVTGLDQSVELLEYRAGNSKSSAPQLLAGLARPVTVTLTRGVIGSELLQQWLNTSLTGIAERRNVTVQLLSEDRAGVAQEWRLTNAIPVAIKGPTLNANTSAIAIEQMVLVAESLSVQ